MPPRKAVIHPSFAAWTHRSTIFACVVSTIESDGERSRVVVVGPSMIFICDEDGGVKRTLSMKKITKVVHINNNIILSLDKEEDLKVEIIQDNRNVEDPKQLSEIIAIAAKKEVIRTSEIPTHSTPPIEKGSLKDRIVEQNNNQTDLSNTRSFTSPLAPNSPSPRRVSVTSVEQTTISEPTQRYHHFDHSADVNLQSQQLSYLQNKQQIQQQSDIITSGVLQINREELHRTAIGSQEEKTTEVVQTPSHAETPTSYLMWLTEQRSEGQRLCKELNNVMDSVTVPSKSGSLELNNHPIPNSSLLTVVPIAPPAMYSVPDIELPSTRSSTFSCDTFESNSTAPPKFLESATSSELSEQGSCSGNQLWIDMTDRMMISSGVKISDMSGALSQTLHSVFKNNLKFNSLQSGLLLSEWRRRVSPTSSSSTQMSLLIQDLHSRLSKYQIKLVALLPSPLVLFSLVCVFLKFNFVQIAVLETAWPRLSGMNYLENDDYPGSIWSDLTEKLRRASQNDDGEQGAQTPTDVFESCMCREGEIIVEESSVQLLVGILKEIGYNAVQSAVLYCEWLRRRSSNTQASTWEQVSLFIKKAIITSNDFTVTLESVNKLKNEVLLPNDLRQILMTTVQNEQTATYAPSVHASALGTGSHCVYICLKDSPSEPILKIVLNIEYLRAPQSTVPPAEVLFSINCDHEMNTSRSIFLWNFSSWYLNDSIRRENDTCTVINVSSIVMRENCFWHHNATASEAVNQLYDNYLIRVGGRNFQPPITSDVLVIGCEPKLNATHSVVIELVQKVTQKTLCAIHCDITRRSTFQAAGTLLLHESCEVNLEQVSKIIKSWKVCSKLIATRASVTPDTQKCFITIENINQLVDTLEINSDDMNIYIEVCNSPGHYFETCEFGTGVHTIFIVKREVYSEVMVRLLKVVISISTLTEPVAVSPSKWKILYKSAEQYLHNLITSNVTSVDVVGPLNHGVLCTVGNIFESKITSETPPLLMGTIEGGDGSYSVPIPNTTFTAITSIQLVECDIHNISGDKSILQTAHSGSNSLKQLKAAGSELEALANQLQHNSKGQFKALDVEAESLRKQLADQKQRAEEEIKSISESGINELHTARGRITALQAAVESGLVRLKESLSSDAVGTSSNVAYLRNVIAHASSALVIPHPIVPIVRSGVLPKGLLEISNIRIIPKHTNPTDITLIPPSELTEQLDDCSSTVEPWGTTSSVTSVCPEGGYPFGVFNYIINKGEGGLNVSSSVAIHNRSTACVTDLVQPTAGQFFMTSDVGSTVGGNGGCHIDFDLNRYRLRPSAYKLEHGVRKSSAFALRNWILEASGDQQNWIILAEHHNDQHLGSNQSHTWPLAEGAGAGHFFQHFRIRLTSPCANSTSWCICLSSVEFYGTLRTIDPTN